MNIDLDYKTFCDTYYDAAVQVADITIAEHIKSHGQLNPYIDVTLVKDLGISYGLEKVYNTFDVDHESRAKIKTYLSKVVHNCVLTELGKESTSNVHLQENLKTHFITEEGYKAALVDDFGSFIEKRGNSILAAINKVCRVNDGVNTMNSNLDEDEQEVLLDGTLEEDTVNQETTSRSRKPNLTFEMIGIPEGSMLTFIPTGIEVKTLPGNIIEYNGKEYTMSAFAAEFMPADLRTPSEAYQGPKFFSYNGECLIDIRAKIEAE